MEADKPITKSEEYWTENLVQVEANHNQTKHSDRQESLYSNAERIISIRNDSKNKTQILESIVQKNNQSTSQNNHHNYMDNTLRIHYDDIRDKTHIGTSGYECKLYAYIYSYGLFLECLFFVLLYILTSSYRQYVTKRQSASCVQPNSKDWVGEYGLRH